jgi:cytidylate kinase
VTISRESGSLGLALGRRVAARLGFAFWDQELVAAVAERLHIDSATASALDGHAPDRMEVLLTALRLARGGLATDYCEQLRVLLASIGHHGGAVVVGRGAHCVILSTHALRVRLVAPVDLRVVDHARSCEISGELAAREVEAGDRERAEFVARTFHANVANPSDYDLVINVGTYTPLRAESLVLMAYLAKFGHLPDEAHNTEYSRQSGVIRTGRGSVTNPAERTG